jgi:hypothetical protein
MKLCLVGLLEVMIGMMYGEATFHWNFPEGSRETPRHKKSNNANQHTIRIEIAINKPQPINGSKANQAKTN